MNAFRIAVVPEFPDYVITTRGRIYKRDGRGGFKAIMPTPRRHSGHLLVLLYRGEKTAKGRAKPYGRSVHRLVLEAFVGPCPEGMEARHLNGKEWENNLGNLKWGTRQDNIDDRPALHEQAQGIRKPNAILSESLVVQMRRRCRAGEFAINIAQSIGVKTGTAVAAIVGRTWKHVTEPPVRLEVNRWKRCT